MLLNLFQAFIIATILGGVFERIASPQMRIGSILAIALLLVLGVILADDPNKKEK